LRRVPELNFKYDDSLIRGQHIEALLEQIARERQAQQSANEEKPGDSDEVNA